MATYNPQRPVHDCMADIKVARNLLIVGEGDFTGTVALCAALGASAVTPRIVSTQYERSVPPAFESVQVKCVANGKVSGSGFSLRMYREANETGGSVVELTSDSAGLWLSGVDATNLRTSIVGSDFGSNSNATKVGDYLCGDAENAETRDPKFGAIWWNCPWFPEECNATDTILLRFLRSASEVQASGGKIFIGLSRVEEYSSRYCEDSILDESAHDYNFEGADNGFVRTLCPFGYKHQSVNGRDIHDFLLRNGIVTLCFVKR